MPRFSTGMSRVGRRQYSPVCPVMFAHYRSRNGKQGVRGAGIKQSRQKLPQAWSAQPAAGLGAFGAKNNLLQARLARIRIHRDSGLSETFGFALNLNRTQLPELGVGCLLRHQHGGSHKLTGNSQPDEILRKENKSRGSRRDSHVPKTMAVKTIRNRGDAAKTAALQSM